MVIADPRINLVPRRHMPDEEVRALLGDEADDLPQQQRSLTDRGWKTPSDPFTSTS
jgi:hypothetical protein